MHPPLASTALILPSPLSSLKKAVSKGTRRAACHCLGVAVILYVGLGCAAPVSPVRDAADERAQLATSTPLAAAADTSPPRRVDPSTASDASGADLPWLSPTHVGAAVRAHHGEFQACQALGDLESRREDGAVTVGWAVQADGSVKRVAVDASTFASDRINACVLGVAKQVTFPRSASPSDVSWTVKFRGAAHAPLADATPR